MKKTAQATPMTFTSRVFGEGNHLVYNVACQYTHTTDLWEVNKTGREILHPNIAICEFDECARVLNEWEIYDVLAVYKQLGVIKDSKENMSFVQVFSRIVSRKG